MKRTAFALTLLVAALSNISPAFAHTSLVASTPKANSTISRLPQNIVLTFDDPLLVFGKKAINSVEVLNPLGQAITSATSVVKGRILSNYITVKSSSVGKYRVSYRVVAQDGHVVTGGFIFSVSNKPKQ